MARARNAAMILGVTLTLCAPAAVAQTLRPDADNRSGTISAFINGFGNVDPVEDGYNVDQSEVYLPIVRNISVNDGGNGHSASASMNTDSRYIGLNQQQFTIRGLRFESQTSAAITIAATGASGHAIANENISMGFRVEDLGAGQSVSYRLRGAVQATGGTASVRLTGPGGLNLNFTGGSFDQVVTIAQNGEYQLRGVSDLTFTRTAPGTASGSASIRAAFIPDCACDWNADAELSSEDFFTYLDSFFEGDADFDGDGTTDATDFFAFLNCFFGGC